MNLNSKRNPSVGNLEQDRREMLEEACLKGRARNRICKPLYKLDSASLLSEHQPCPSPGDRWFPYDKSHT